MGACHQYSFWVKGPFFLFYLKISDWFPKLCLFKGLWPKFLDIFWKWFFRRLSHHVKHVFLDWVNAKMISENTKSIRKWFQKTLVNEYKTWNFSFLFTLIGADFDIPLYVYAFPRLLAGKGMEIFSDCVTGEGGVGGNGAPIFHSQSRNIKSFEYKAVGF